MARPLSANSHKVLRQLGSSAKSLDELSARTGMRKDRVAKLLWSLQSRGWIAESQETRQLRVYRRIRAAPAQKRPEVRWRRTQQFTGLYTAFRMRLPTKRRRGRIVRRGD